MNDIETAGLRLALFTLVFLAILIGVIRLRRPRAERTAPGMPRFARQAPPVEETEIAPSRLARVRARPAAERISESGRPPAMETATPPPAETVPADSAPMDAEEQAPLQEAAPLAVRLIPRMIAQEAAAARSRMGGRPHLPAAMPWPRIDGRDADFLAQIACADLPADLWDGLGPRSGSILLFAHPDSGAPMALHVEADGPPRDPPRAAGILWSGPEGGLAAFARRAFPEWPVDVVPGEIATPGAVATDAAPGYDVADPAFHPFDWDSIVALAALLENRLSADPVAPADANDELLETIAEAAETNREARLCVREIVAIIRDSAGEAPFSAEDAAAVMDGLHAIRWTSVTAAPDSETGEDRVETLTLPLTRHHPGADLWVEDYRRLLADHAKHVGELPAATRALVEPLWQDMATRETAASMGGRPDVPLLGFDEERDALLFVLPASALMNRARPGGRDMIVAIRKADLATGDFSRLRLLGD